MVTKLVLPTEEELEFFYLRKWQALGDLIYLHSIRSGRVDENSPMAIRYRNLAPMFAFQLASMIRNFEFEALVSPPSARNDTKVYRDGIIFSKRKTGVITPKICPLDLVAMVKLKQPTPVHTMN